VNYEGEVRDINLVERLIELWREQFTGAIRFENDGIIKIVYFKGGDILSASTNDRADSVDEILMRAGKVSKEHVKQALSKRKENETLGDALLNLGFITRKELTWARRIQVINVVRSIEGWNAGSFTVVADYLPKREEGTIFPLPQLVVEMIVTDQDRGKFERALESGSVVFTKAPGHEETFRKLGLNEDAEAVMAQVDGERQATEVAAASRQETFNAFKLLHALSILGILQKRTAPAAGLGFESAGVADAADVWGGGGGGGAQFELDDAAPAPSPSFSMSDDIAPVPGLADPSFDAPGMSTPSWDAPAPVEPPPAPPSSNRIDPEPAAASGDMLSWGFDEAQVETARKVTSAQSLEVPRAMPPAFTPPPPPPQPPASFGGEGTMSRRGIGETTTTRRVVTPMKRKAPRYGLLIALMVLFVLAAVGYFGYTWWSGREAAVAQPAQPVTRTATAPTATVPPLVPPPTQTLEAVPAAQAPLTATAAPPVAATATGSTRVPEGDRARFDAMARDFAANPNGNFTVQFAIVCDPSNVTKALRTSSDVWFAPISLKERPCFRMFWGRYGTRAEAEAAMERLPGELRESRPAVVGIPR
jgi:hypothetical protein